MDLKFDTARQYYISISAAETDCYLPEIFINVYRKKKRIECQTLDLVKLNQKIVDAHNEVVSMSDQTIQELIRDVCTEISTLFRVSEAIAMLDMLSTFAQLATCNDYIRPELTDVLAIKSGRHPLREKIHTKKYIPNDAYATPQSRFQIITGCNMSGKSTYIRALALMTIMAQIGSFVPAEYASFPLIQQLFARVSTADDLEANVSTFASEMREMAFILRSLELTHSTDPTSNNNKNSNSMVLIDELGRGTSTTDGLSIALAIAEALLCTTHALTWFVTHFHDLATILSARPGAVSLHLAADLTADGSKMTMLYRIAEGVPPAQAYGLALANLVDLAPDVMSTARSVSAAMDGLARRRHSRARSVAVAHKRRLLLALREQLVLARCGTVSGEGLRRWLVRLQDEFVVRMDAADGDDDSLGDGDGDASLVGCDDGNDVDDADGMSLSDGDVVALATDRVELSSDDDGVDAIPHPHSTTPSSRLPHAYTWSPSPGADHLVSRSHSLGICSSDSPPAMVDSQ